MTGPAVVADAPMPATLDAALGVILTETKTQHAVDTGEIATPERQRDEHGRFLPATEPVASSEAPAEGASVPADAPIAEGAPDGDAPIDIPEGYVAVDVLPDDKARGFKVFDAEGEIAPPNLTFKLNANGKDRELTTDKLVAYAQMGVYNHEREQAMQETQQRAHQVEQRLQQTEQAIEQRDRQIEALLSDPEYLLRAQLAFEQQNTPEARAQRERETLEADRQRFQIEQITQQTAQFLDAEIAPALEQIAAALPEVSREELAARLYLHADRYRVNGLLVPQGFGPLRKAIIDDLVPYAQQLNEHRASGKIAPKQEIAKVQDKATADVAAAQTRAQKARSVASRALRPAGRAMPETPPEPVVRNFKDAESVIIGRTKDAMRASG